MCDTHTIFGLWTIWGKWESVFEYPTTFEKSFEEDSDYLKTLEDFLRTMRIFEASKRADLLKKKQANLNFRHSLWSSVCRIGPFQNLVRGLLCIIFQVISILSWEKQKKKNWPMKFTDYKT